MQGKLQLVLKGLLTMTTINLCRVGRYLPSSSLSSDSSPSNSPGSKPCKNTQSVHCHKLEVANGEYETLGDSETTIIFSANLRL